jgi:beta-phosphoglucomutase-like phosphatase (HAD superfamily)
VGHKACHPILGDVELLASTGVEAYAGAVAFLKSLRRMSIKTAVVTSSQNCQAVLQTAKVDDLFDARVHGDVLAEQGLVGKPAPDSFLKAAEMHWEAALPAPSSAILAEPRSVIVFFAEH